MARTRSSSYQALRNTVLSALGGRCACGFSDPRALQIDHVFSDGCEERRRLRGIAFLRHVLAHIDSGRYQLLCASCNWIKRFEKMEGVKRFSLDDVTDLDTFIPEPDLLD